MIDNLIDLIDIVVKGTRRLNTKRKLEKLQEEGIDRYIWILRGIDIGFYPYFDQVYGLQKALINFFDYKQKNESSQEYIDSLVEGGKIIRDGRNIIVKKWSIELNFGIEGERISKKYERFTFSDSEREKLNLEGFTGDVEVRYHELELTYKGWNLKTNLLVGTDQFLQKPDRIEFLNGG